MSQKKALKKKKREQESHKKVLARREALRAPKIEENQTRKKLKRIEKLQKEMSGLNQWANDVLINASEKTLSQLEKNAKILNALEAEYEKELEAKKKLNQELEAKGAFSLEQKLEFLHNNLVEQQDSLNVKISNEENKVKKNSNKEIAEVSIVKAPGFEDSN